jgi:hypothetical protein
MESGLLDSFSNWLKTTSLSAGIIHSSWIWPAAETVHFIGLALLIGSVALLDLRMLGLAKQLPVRPLHRLLFLGLIGFVLNVVTGLVFFVGAPSQYVHNVSFWLKMLLMFAAGMNALLFYVTGVFLQVEKVGPGEDAPFRAKVIAATSLLLWIGVTYFGRMLPFIGEAF